VKVVSRFGRVQRQIEWQQEGGMSVGLLDGKKYQMGPGRVVRVWSLSVASDVQDYAYLEKALHDNGWHIVA